MSKEITLEEAKKQLNKFKSITILYGNTFAMTSQCVEEIQNSIEVVLQALETAQEHERQYMNVEIFSAKQVKFEEEQRKKWFIHKNVIKEKIEELNCRMAKYKEYVAQGKETDTEYYENIADIQTKRILEEILQEGGCNK